ncbi:MAG: DUF1549 domain-containing protein [Planctomycetales bacterium]|nr:DUF1549 domain-containing protein [Planctomycetales bacterium]
MLPRKLVACLSRIVALGLLLGVGGETLHAQKSPPKKKLPSQKFQGYGGLPACVKSPPQDLPSVPPVASSLRGECRQAAAKIDALVEAKLAEQGLEPNPDADDYTFVRRVFLDITGSIPTLQHTNAYASSKQSRKQEELVDLLLGSYGYVSHMYNYWASILRITDRQRNILAYSYRDWVKEQLRINRPYDEWVYEMLTAEGKLWENPAVGYTLRDEGMPLVHVDNTVRVFLGTQIGCAQCHDHPFDHWTQKQFYQLAAFTNGTRTRDGGGSMAFQNGNPVTRLTTELKKIDPDKRLSGSMNVLLQANLHRVSFDEKRPLKLPADYRYDDGKPNEVVAPNVLWGSIPDDDPSLSPREQYAKWLTSADNPRFAKTLANRLWKKVMGVGLIEPVDDFMDDSPCQNPQLLELLSEELIRLKFDQKEFLRLLLYTKTYQRGCSDFDPSEAEFYHFPGPCLRRMTAEQVWDSILTIAVYNPFSFRLPDTSQFAQVVDLDLGQVTLSEVEARSTQFDASVGPSGRSNTMNVAAYRRQVLARASELPSPLPADHFLRQFGQCDRETIEGDSTAPTVPQILTMFNGPFTHMMLEQGSVIHDNLSRATSARDAMNVMFLSILNRPPTSRDRDIAMREMSRGDTVMGYGNLVWALINTREFLFVQ